MESKLGTLRIAGATDASRTLIARLDVGVGETYDAYITTPIFNSDGEAVWGLCDFDAHEILIDSALTNVDRAMRVLGHEYIHAWLYENGWHTPMDNGGAIERNVEAMTAVMAAWERQCDRHDIRGVLAHHFAGRRAKLPYAVQVMNGTLIVNGKVAGDFLDTVDRVYQVATTAKITPEIRRLVRFAFERGAEAIGQG